MIERCFKRRTAVRRNTAWRVLVGRLARPSPARGRSVSRLEHEDLVDELRARMETPEAKELYRLRRQTIELRYADLKQHRQLATISTITDRDAPVPRSGRAVLAYNLLILQKNRKTAEIPVEPMKIPEEVPS